MLRSLFEHCVHLKEGVDLGGFYLATYLSLCFSVCLYSKIPIYATLCKLLFFF